MAKKRSKRTWKDRKDKRIIEENKAVIEWANYKDRSRKNAIYAFTKDLSIGGAKILTDVKFPVDTIFVITLTLSRSRQILSLPAHVKWVNPVYDGDLYEAGLEFVHEQPQAMAGLFKHLFGKEIRPALAEKLVEVEARSNRPA